MMRFALPSIGILALAGQAWGQSYNVREDDQLKTPVTLSVKYGPIRDVLKAIGKQTGTSFSVSGLVSDLKVTVFVNKIPGNVVLDRIGSVLDCQWSNDKGLRILNTTPEASRMLTNYLSAEDAVLRTKAEDQLKQLIDKGNDPSSTDTTTPTDASPLPRRRRFRGAGPMESLPAQITKIFNDASSSDMDTFWSGSILHFEVQDPVTPPANADANPPTNVNVQKTALTVVYARYDYWGAHMLQFGTSKTPVVPQPFVIPALTQPIETLADTPYGKKVLAWPDMNLKDGEEEFSKPLPPDPDAKVSFKPRTSLSGADDSVAPRRTQTDLLEEFSSRSGIPIVSDGFRTTLPPETPDPNGATPLDWLKSFSSQFGNFVQIKDGIATVRQGGFWRLRQYEIPEDSLQPMTKSAGSLGLNDYARFFYGLTAAQSRSFASSTPPKVDFSVESIVPVIPALRVIGSLSSDFPTNGRLVPVSDLGADSQTLIAEAIAESVFSGESWQPNTQAKTEPFCLTLQSANISQPEGTVPGISLQFVLPIGQTVDYQIPLKLVF